MKKKQPRNFGVEFSGKVAELTQILGEARKSMPDQLVETVFKILKSKPREEWTEDEKNAARIVEYDKREGTLKNAQHSKN